MKINFYFQKKEIFSNTYSKRLDKIEELTEKIDCKFLSCHVRVSE